MLLDKIDNVTRRTARIAFRDHFHQLHAREQEPPPAPGNPFPSCGRICDQHPPVCLYRHSAAALIAGGKLKKDSGVAEAYDVEHGAGRRSRTWNVCVDAASHLIEAPQPGWSDDERKAAALASTRRCALCFGQQMLLTDGARLPVRSRQIVDKLLYEAGYE